MTWESIRVLSGHPEDQSDSKPKDQRIQGYNVCRKANTMGKGPRGFISHYVSDMPKKTQRTRIADQSLRAAPAAMILDHPND